MVAKAAAENAVEILNKAIEENGRAVWVLAGGSSPLAAYKLLVKYYADAVDWAKVTVLMGDERFVPLTHSDSNWGSIMPLFQANQLTAAIQVVQPEILETVASTAIAYSKKIQALAINRFDLVWIGVGEDGHTLSLFPANVAFINETSEWVIPVYDSPKAPGERITLSLKAMEYISELVIFAVGASKKKALKEARLKRVLPIAIVAEVAEMNGAEVRWLYDDAAWE